MSTKYTIKDRDTTDWREKLNEGDRKKHKVHVTDISDVREHAEDLWEAGTSPTHDFDSRANERSREKFISDRIEGKVGEHVFKQFLSKLGFDSEVDYDIYESEQVTDDADLKSIEGDDPAIGFDVKTTKKKNKWLAIRESIYRTHESDDPFILVLVNPEKVHQPPFTAEVVGWVEKKDLDIRLERGDRMHIPGDKSFKIGPQLKTNNLCIPVEDITRRTEDEWEEFVENRLVK